MKERILLVEDDSGLLQYCSYLLSREKYAVTACSSAAEASALIRGAGRYDILLSDFHLGDGCGADLISLAKRVIPAARALLMSGDDSRHAALRKPFSSKEFLSTVGGAGASAHH